MYDRPILVKMSTEQEKWAILEILNMNGKGK